MRTRPASSRVAGILAGVILLAASLAGEVVSSQIAPAAVPPRQSFTEIAEAAGVRFRHLAGRTPDKYMIETMGSGVCFLDYDGDGDPDLYFVQSGPDPGTPGPRPGNVLYRNDGKGHFTDVTASAHVGDTGYGMGCAAGDVDNDGDEDLFVANFGPDVLYRNNGDGTFTEVGQKAGVSNPLWSTSAAFADYDADGWLDLYVANYVDFTMDNNKWCGDFQHKIRAYCHPDAYEGVPDTLYHNNRDGTFTNKAVDLGNPDLGYVKGVAWGDYNNDGRQDLYVSVLGGNKRLFRNDGKRTPAGPAGEDWRFTDVAKEAGVVEPQRSIVVMLSKSLEHALR